MGNGGVSVSSGTINLGDASDTTSAGNLLLTGGGGVAGSNGAIILGASASNFLGQDRNEPLTIGAGITISGQSGTIGTTGGRITNDGNVEANVNGGAVKVYLGNGGLNEGNLAVSNFDTMTVSAGGTSGSAWTNTGDISAVTGGILGLDLTGSLDGWDSTGTLSANNATVDLGGQFTQADLGEFTFNSGTVVNITGTLTGGLDLSSAGGSWYLSGGTIQGGTITTGEKALTADGGTLNGVTLQGNVEIGPTSGATLTVIDGLTLNNFATIIIDGSDAVSGDTLVFSGDQNGAPAPPGTSTSASNRATS